MLVSGTDQEFANQLVRNTTEFKFKTRKFIALCAARGRSTREVSRADGS